MFYGHDILAEVIKEQGQQFYLQPLQTFKFKDGLNVW